MPDFADPAAPVVSLCEGNTPLIEAPRLAPKLGLPANFRLFLKFEGMNPTGSFKDRGMTAAVSVAKKKGMQVVMCASTGNTSAAASAYAARADMKSVVILPKGEVALGKLSQALIHGAKVLAISGNFDDALTLVRDICAEYPIELVNSVNPVRIEGQKTAAFEIVDALGDAPDFHALPVGNAGNITAYWRGFREFAEAGKATRRPRMLGFQAAGSAPLVLGHPVDKPERSRPRSESANRRPGTAPSPPATIPGDRSSPSPTNRSSKRTPWSRPPRASSPNRPARRLWPA
jgi:threonine synthase